MFYNFCRRAFFNYRSGTSFWASSKQNAIGSQIILPFAFVSALAFFGMFNAYVIYGVNGLKYPMVLAKQRQEEEEMARKMAYREAQERLEAKRVSRRSLEEQRLIRQRELSVPWTCWLIPMRQKIIDRSEVA